MDPLSDSSILIRRAHADDAPGIVSVWEAVVAERLYTAIDRAFSIENERTYLKSLTRREAVFIALQDRRVVGFQTLDLWVHYTHSMDHVGQIGTFVLNGFRSSGVGRRLTEETLEFARSVGYEKIVIFVRASNPGAQRFYQRLGFKPCGQLAHQVKIDGKYDDETMMELFL